MNPLQLRLAAVRRRLRLVTTFRGACWLLSLLLAAMALAGLLDWRLHLPGLVRAVWLVAALGAAGLIAFRYLLKPLAGRADDLTLALRVEEQHPSLTDALASALQFLEQPDATDRGGSPGLRKQAVERALGMAEGIDFGRVVDTRGMRVAGLSLLGCGALAVALVLLSPSLAWTALLRLANPFGDLDWPRQTQLDVQAKSRVARGEPFDVRVTLRGVIPERAAVVYRFDTGTAEQLYDIKPAGPSEAAFLARLEAGRVQRNFRVQVRANDAVSPWHDVTVLPPPQLVPLDGRPCPQIHLEFPPYTDLPPHDVPDGTGSVEAIAGTAVTLRAAADRPLSRAWLEVPQNLTVPAFLSAFAERNPLAAVVAWDGARQGAWRRIEAWLAPDRQVFVIDFTARVSGSYVLHFEDESRLGNDRLIEMLITPDPAPAVQLERPSKSQDSLDVLPGAVVTLQILADDPTFAVRSVYLEYRHKRRGAEAPPRRLPLYDPSLGWILPLLGSQLSTAPVKVPGPPLRLRPQRVPVARRWSLKELDLKEGDTVVLQACADDFDDVTVNKEPGRSHEIELRVVSRNALEAALNNAQAHIQQELLRLQQQQQDAIQKVIGPEAQWRNNQGKLQPQHLDELIQAEQTQQQIRARVGTKQEGLRAEVARVLQAIKDNQLPRSSTNDRMETVGRELDRLTENELEQIEPRLTDARKQNEAGAKRDAVKDGKNPLQEARAHQEEVSNTLGNLLKLMEPWSDTREMRGEARSILEEQRRLAEETASLPKEKGIASGVPRERLSDRQKAELDRAAETQRKLAERTGQLLSKMDRVAKDKSQTEPDIAEALRDAAQQGQKNNVEGTMRQAGQSLQQNQQRSASSQQQQSSKSMEQVVQALEERREAELDKLIKKLKEAEQKMADLARRQDELRKKAKEAAKISDPQKREEELRRLAREQEKLQKEAQEMARELTRLRADRAGQSLSQAGGQMGQANRQLERGGEAEQQQDEALDRLNDAQQELQQAREDAEEELGREKLAKIADQLKGLKERQESRIVEAGRIHREVLQQKGWTRALLASAAELARAQKDLGGEARGLAREKLDKAKIFAHLLEKAAEAMEQAGVRVEERRQNAGAEPELNVAAESSADGDTQKTQRTAVRRLDQLLDALKPGGAAARQPPQEGEGGEGGGGGGGGGPRAPGEQFPPMAQLKALKALQLDVNERTETFHQKHPDAAKLSEKEKVELQGLKQEQQEIADLFQQLAEPAASEGEKK